MRNIGEIFNDRTCNKFQSKPVDRDLLLKIYNLMKLGPTSANCSPLRILFVQSEAEKQKLYNCVMPGNLDKTKSAPVIALFAYDTKFYDHMAKLFPHNPGIKDYFASSEGITLDTATRNSTLQASYFMIVARGLGLSCGPMSGFDADSINKNFFSGTNFKVNFICNLGYADGPEAHARLPRFEFDECCKIV
jgi:3-hydroxypropanoate dehydrogenase